MTTSHPLHASSTHRRTASLAISTAALLVAACGSEVLVLGGQPGDETPDGQPPNGDSPADDTSHAGAGETSTNPGQGASGLGGNAGGPSTGPNCSGGLQACGDSCVDLQFDDLHCGSCGNACAAGFSCVWGDCSQAGSCAPPLSMCGGSCVDLLSDEAHCGGCFQPCEAQASCAGGSCTCASSVCGTCDIGMLSPELPASVQGTATSNHVEPSCAPPGSPDAFYRFIAPQDALYVFDTVGSSYDTVLLLVDEPCDQSACNDDHFGVTSRLTTSLAAGEQVLLVVDGYGGDSGHFVLNASLGGDPVLCPQLELDSSAPQTITGSTVGQPAGYDDYCGGWGQPEVSHRFQAPEAGDYIFHTDGSSFDTVLYVRDGDCDGPTLACNDDSIGTNSIVLVTMQPQQEVIIFVDSYYEPGAYQLTVAGPL